MNINVIFNLIIFIVLFELLFPLVINSNQNIDITKRVIAFLLLPITELLLFIWSILINKDNIGDLLELAIFGLLIIFGFSFTLIWTCVKDINHRVKQILKFSALLVFSLSMVMEILLSILN